MSLVQRAENRAPVVTRKGGSFKYRGLAMFAVPALGIALLGLFSCARFQPTQPALSASDYSLSGMRESFTMSDSSIHYEPNLLQVGVSRPTVVAQYGEPNDSHTTDNGLMEDVYAFNPDGTKFVDPKIRPRNVALGVFTRGASTAVRQARLGMKERKLTLFHVTYTPDQTIQSVRIEKLSGAPDQLPASTSTGSPGS